MELTKEQESKVEEKLNRVTEDDFDNYLDTEESIVIFGIPYAASLVLKEVDPTAYRCGYNDWLDGEGIVEIDGDFYRISEIEEVLEEINEEIEEETNG